MSPSSARTTPRATSSSAPTTRCSARRATARAASSPTRLRSLKPNRSIPSAAVIPVLVYPDVRAAVAFLTDAFGFRERLQIGEDHRSQLEFGGGAVIVGDVRGDRVPPRAGESTHQVMVRVDDARGHCERARDRGAAILMEPRDFEYGERQYSCADPWGHHWTFSQTLEDVDPASWGGELKR